MGKQPAIFLIWILVFNLVAGVGLAFGAPEAQTETDNPARAGEARPTAAHYPATLVRSILEAQAVSRPAINNETPNLKPEPQPAGSLNSQIWQADGSSAGEAFKLSPPKTGANLSWEMGKAALALVFVLGIIIFSFKALSRFGVGSKGGKGYFKMTGTLALDNKKYLAAIEVEGRRLILGVTPESINLLQAWPIVEFSELAEKGEFFNEASTYVQPAKKAIPPENEEIKE